MSRVSSPSGRTGRPPLTSRTQILAAARRLIDRDGWEQLTIRRLAADLGVGATTLYHHIRDKHDLLVLLLTDAVDQIDRPRLPDDPRERIVTVATAMHDALATWPWAAEVLTTDGFVGLLDESALWMVESIVAAAAECGCTQERSVDVFRSIWYYTVGEILVRAHSDRRPAAESPTHPVSFDRFNPEQLPQLAAIGNRWPALAARDTYRSGLRALVIGLTDQTDPTSP